MSRIVFVYHSGYGHTRKQGEAVHQGATGVIAQSPSDSSAEKGPFPGDLETAAR